MDIFRRDSFHQLAKAACDILEGDVKLRDAGDLKELCSIPGDSSYATSCLAGVCIGQDGSLIGL